MFCENEDLTNLWKRFKLVKQNRTRLFKKKRQSRDVKNEEIQVKSIKQRSSFKERETGFEVR